MEIYVVVGSMEIERELFESVEGKTFDTIDSVMYEFKGEKVAIYTLSNFVYECNTEACFLEEAWISYVKIEEQK